MHFTWRTIEDVPVQFGSHIFMPERVRLRWLGVWFDPKLNFSAHIQHMKKTGDPAVK